MPVPSACRPLLEPQLQDGERDSIVVGLVNSMPDAALRTTERQFRELLCAASCGLAVCLRVFSLPGLPRTDAGRSYVAEYHQDISELWVSAIDGLIVTGTEPRAPTLQDEPYWPALTKLVDWAEEHTNSTIWSCLAAHAAVLHMDGIVRRALPAKLSGVFDCVTTADHAIAAGIPPRWRLPHSRYNELPEEALLSKGYCMLSTSRAAGANMFIKQRKSLFVFLQGHPEYDRGALLREYRRDIGRFLAGERDSYPEMPDGYFDQATAAAFTAFRQRALRHRDIGLLETFPGAEAEEKLLHIWREPAVRLYANWLSYLAAQRAQPRHPGGIALSATTHPDVNLERERAVECARRSVGDDRSCEPVLCPQVQR